MLAFPIMTAPQADNLSTTVALFGGMKFPSMVEAQVVRVPFVHMLSLINTGMPVSGVLFPSAMRASDCCARSMAASRVTVMKAFTLSSTFSIRSRQSFVSSTEDIFLFRNRSDAS
jgi:hypothetical protein